MNSKHNWKDTRNRIISPQKAEQKARACQKAIRRGEVQKFYRSEHFLQNLAREFDQPSNKQIKQHLADGEWELDVKHFNQPNERTPTKGNKTWSQARFKVYYAGTTIVYAPANRTLITIWGDRRKPWTEKDFEDWVLGKALLEKNLKDVAKVVLQSSPVKLKVKNTGRSWLVTSKPKPVALPPPTFHDSNSDSGSELGTDPKSTSPSRMALEKKSECMIYPISSWSVATVCDWAEAVGIKAEAVQIFKEEEITGEVLLTLSSFDFYQMNENAGRRVFTMGTIRTVELEKAKALERERSDQKSA